MGRTNQPVFGRRMLCAALGLLCSQVAWTGRHEVLLLPPAANGVQQGFVRIINRSNQSGAVRIVAIDDSGNRAGPVALSLDARATTHFNSSDLETGNPAKGLSGRTGSGQGDWRLALETALDIEVLAYIRTTDGFLTSMHDLVPGERSASGTLHLVPIFNPSKNRNQVSRLRVVNANEGPARVDITGVDDQGTEAPQEVSLTLSAGEARTLTARDLEEGASGLGGRFGDGGSGKWWLRLSSDQPLQVMNLLESPTGNLTNLSTRGPHGNVPLFVAASNPTQQGFVRITNYTDGPGTVHIVAIDDAGRRFGPIDITLDALATVHFNSDDLENGNPEKGLSEGVGSGQGDWRLELDTELDMVTMLAYVRTSDGFLTSVHDVARSAQNFHHVPIFNPASNDNQRSSLRLVNPGVVDAEVVIAGLDDLGRPPPNGGVRLTLPAGEARTISAQDLERSGTGFKGRFGDGSGKWQLSVSANRSIQVVSLLESPTGNLTNLSTSVAPLVDGNAAPVAQDISLRADLSNPIVAVQLIGRDADGDTLIYVLDSASEGDGYYDAFVEPDTGRLFASLRDDGQERVVVTYRVTDGMRFSGVAHVRVAVEQIESGGLGLSAAAPATYGRAGIRFFDDSNLPPSVDLSANFPPVGSQGLQSSCVGWAVGHALKSFHERLEEGWEFGPATVFSPAWIYNQINGGRDNGALIHNALTLIVEDGAATRATMPYNAGNYLAQPTDRARMEARRYRASDWSRVQGTGQIKAALFNRMPVVIGMQTYDSFNHLRGADSVYNTFGGQAQGGHAVTIVGYDDSRFDGAFKVINSWGTRWGDGGFFYLPYRNFSHVVSVSYVLQDAVNGEEPPPEVPLRPVEGNLPNLEVQKWYAEYDPRPGGSGSWQWTVVNTGTAVAPRGADVNLILSQDEELDSTDWWVVWEEIPFDLAPGERAARGERNAREFIFPETLSAGAYYMTVWVDDLQEVRESNENDNVSPVNRKVEITPPALPDLAIDYWWASWSNAGEGVLEYDVVNDGSAPTTRTDWDINLILSKSERPEGDWWYLFYEDAGNILSPGEVLYRREQNRARFNLLEDQFGNRVPAGVYYMSLWVDDLDEEEEGNEVNNLSVGNRLVEVNRPDLAINSWKASWSSSGNGVLEYEVVNEGTAQTTRTDWDINLVLSKTRRPDREGTTIWYLFYEDAGYVLAPGQGIFRSEGSQARFNLFEDQFGDRVPAGTYYMSLWVDDQNLEAESNELNNVSVADGSVTLRRMSSLERGAAIAQGVGGRIVRRGVRSTLVGSSALAGPRRHYVGDDKRLWGKRRIVSGEDAVRPSSAPKERPFKPRDPGSSNLPERSSVAAPTEATVDVRSAFNGRRLPADIAMRRVEIVDGPEGGRRVFVVEDEGHRSPAPKPESAEPARVRPADAPRRHAKAVWAADERVFPQGETRHMP